MAQRLRPVLLALLFVSITTPVIAATTVTITPDRIYTGLGNREYFPRFATYLPRVLLVPAGQTVTLPADSTWDAIEVAGTLRVARDRDTVVRFTHLTILPGGTLDAGTASDPILANAWFIVRDVPMDVIRDPYQFGNGLINMGRQSRVGRVTTHLVEASGDIPSGATSIALQAPADWRVGDELFLPDTRQLYCGGLPSEKVRCLRRERRVFIASIAPGVITLSKPLDFAHNTIRDPQGVVVLKPRVVNLTRNIVVVSENPQGTRGHTMNLGAQASWDIRYNVLDGLGRTRNVLLDSATVDASGNVTRIGTNQVGRYPSHDHQVGSQPAGVFLGNVLHGTNVVKWGHAVHGTHDTRVESNVALDFPGAGLVTEDGPEVRNVFRRNFVAHSVGNDVAPTTNANNGCPGCEGAGLWFRGLRNVIDGNEGWNNAIGLNLITTAGARGQVPSAPGGAPDTAFDPRNAVPISIADNVTAANTLNGWEWWSTDLFPVVRLISANNNFAQAFAGQSENVNAFLQDAVLVCTNPASWSVAFGSNQAYVNFGYADGGRMAGCAEGVHNGGAADSFRLSNLTMQNRVNIQFGAGTPTSPNPVVFENVTHLPLPGYPKQYIVWGGGGIWEPGSALPYADGRRSNPAQGTRGHILNWQGTGRDYRLYNVQQQRSNPAIPSHLDGYWLCPEAGLTVGECWDRYGTAWGAGVVDEAAAVELEGLLNGIAEQGLDTPLGPPRYVITYPNMTAPAVVVNGGVRLYGLLTGDNTRARTTSVWVSVDGAPPLRVSRGLGQLFDEFSIRTTASSIGTHTVQTWREDAAGRILSESALSFSYFVTQTSEPPPPSPPPPSPTPPPSGEVLLSVGGVTSASSGSAAAAFDGSADTAWNAALPAWLQYELAAPAALKRYVLRAPSWHPAMNPAAWVLAGSQDGVTFDVLDTRTGEAFTEVPKAYEVNATTAYRFYRLTIASAAGGAFVQISDLQLFGVAP
jgi:hypothetical protein